MTLIDTSSWLHQMRPKGDPVVRQRVESLLMAGEAAWCPMVRLELWRGVSTDTERKRLKAYEAALPDLPITDAVWTLACQLGEQARRLGATCNAPDLIIAACARLHGAKLEHSDSDFDRIAHLK